MTSVSEVAAETSNSPKCLDFDPVQKHDETGELGYVEVQGEEASAYCRKKRKISVPQQNSLEGTEEVTSPSMLVVDSRLRNAFSDSSVDLLASKVLAGDRKLLEGMDNMMLEKASGGCPDELETCESRIRVEMDDLEVSASGEGIKQTDILGGCPDELVTCESRIRVEIDDLGVSASGEGMKKTDILNTEEGTREEIATNDISLNDTHKPNFEQDGKHILNLVPNVGLDVSSTGEDADEPVTFCVGQASEESCGRGPLSENVEEKGQSDAEDVIPSVELYTVKVDSADIIDKDNATPKLLQSSPEVACSSCSRKKLLVLDVNGILADIVPYVPIGYDFDEIISRKAVFKRPFVDDFLQFCFERFNVGVWSSRTKRNMEMVIDFLLGETKQKLMFCWDRSHCTETGFNTVENRRKPLVLKELRKLWDKHESDLPWERGDYNESNTLLLDDSPHKALRNPPYTAIFPRAYCYENMKDTSLGPGGDLRVYLEGLATAENVQKYVEQHPFGQRPITKSNLSWRFYLKVIGTTSSQPGDDEASKSSSDHQPPHTHTEKP